MASATYHNLGLIFLQESMAEDGNDPVWPLRKEAIRYLEELPGLEPGSEGTAWNLELALRQLASADIRPGPLNPETQPRATACERHLPILEVRKTGNLTGGQEHGTEGLRESEPISRRICPWTPPAGSWPHSG